MVGSRTVPLLVFLESQSRTKYIPTCRFEKYPQWFIQSPKCPITKTSLRVDFHCFRNRGSAGRVSTTIVLHILEPAYVDGIQVSNWVVCVKINSALQPDRSRVATEVSPGITRTSQHKRPLGTVDGWMQKRDESLGIWPGIPMLGSMVCFNFLHLMLPGRLDVPGFPPRGIRVHTDKAPG